MYKTGVYFGRFCPPHRGHLYQIIEASTRCEKLVVVISDNRRQTEKICREAGMPVITYQLRKQWLCQQVQDMDHIVVRVLDETDIPEYPAGWAAWSARMREVVPEGIDAFFVGDREYEQAVGEGIPQESGVGEPGSLGGVGGGNGRRTDRILRLLPRHGHSGQYRDRLRGRSRRHPGTIRPGRTGCEDL